MLPTDEMRSANLRLEHCRNVGPPLTSIVSDLEDEIFMRAALSEARKAVGKTSPNPAVGAVLVVKNRVIAKGFHRARGSPHAEIECLANVPKDLVRRATLYVTLEPCSTMGRTPPCTKAIVRAGLKKVVIGTTDPNPQHRGRGIEELRAAGIDVNSGVLQAECSRLNEAFNKWIVSRQPFVIAKCGMSLDGRLTRPAGEARWLTSSAARRDAMHLRCEADAILIGAETLRQDNPRLTTRGVGGALQPWRVVLTRSGKLPVDSRLFSDRWSDRTLVYRKKSLARVLAELGNREITSVLIEGGGEILGQAFDKRLVDKVHFYLAPLLTAGPVFAVGGKGVPSTASAARLVDVQYERIGGDLKVTGYPQWTAV
jgi:diaminohydroxyphosphoribosylaminopyrimidine deaminase/5-amino-6-(5-phosphoribosylamino)uracil reductase